MGWLGEAALTSSPVSKLLFLPMMSPTGPGMTLEGLSRAQREALLVLQGPQKGSLDLTPDRSQLSNHSRDAGMHMHDVPKPWRSTGLNSHKHNASPHFTRIWKRKMHGPNLCSRASLYICQCLYIGKPTGQRVLHSVLIKSQ